MMSNLLVSVIEYRYDEEVDVVYSFCFYCERFRKYILLRCRCFCL